MFVFGTVIFYKNEFSQNAVVDGLWKDSCTWKYTETAKEETRTATTARTKDLAVCFAYFNQAINLVESNISEIASGTQPSETV